jgi:hypothetical protein
MARKITLSVPDELYKRIEKWREELGNLSSVFQEAISREIEKRELFESKLKEDKSLQEVAEDGSFNTPASQFAVGKEMGFVYAKTAPYPEIKRYEEYESIWDNQDWEELKGFHFRLNIPSILAGIFEVEKSTTGPKGIPKDAIHLTPSFDLAFMVGIIEFIKEEFSKVEIPKLSPDRERKMYVIKDKKGRTKIIEDVMIVAKNIDEEDWDGEDPLADY